MACGLWEGVGQGVEKLEQLRKDGKTWENNWDELRDAELSIPPGFEDVMSQS